MTKDDKMWNLFTIQASWLYRKKRRDKAINTSGIKSD